MKKYNYEDMVALEKMTVKEAIEALKYVYAGYNGKYKFPRKDEYSDTEYINYKRECAFVQIYKYVKEIEEDD